MTEADKKIRQAQREAKKERKKAYKEQLNQYRIAPTKKEKITVAIAIVLTAVIVLIIAGQTTINVLNDKGNKKFIRFEAKFLIEHYLPESVECNYGTEIGKRETFIMLNEDYGTEKEEKASKTSVEQALNADVLSALSIYYFDDNNEKVVVTNKNTNAFAVIINKSAFFIKAGENHKGLTNGFKYAKAVLYIADAIVLLFAVYFVWGRKYDMRMAMEKDMSLKSTQKRDGLSAEDAKKSAPNNKQPYKKKRKRK